MAKVGRAAYAHAKERVTLVTAASTLTANDSGETIVINHATAFTTTLPAAKKGQTFRFVIAVASTSPHKIAAASGEYFYGSIRVISTTDNKTSSQAVTKAVAVADPGDYDHISLDSNATTSGGVAGDVIELYCVEDGGWLVSAILTLSTGSPSSIAVIGAS